MRQLLVLVAVLACRSGYPSAQSQVAPAPSASAAIETLQKNHPDAEIRLNRQGDRVRLISGLKSASGGSTPEAIVDSVLRDDIVAAALGLSPDLRELCDPVTRRDPQSATRAVVRIQQCVGGVRVLGAEIVMNVRMAEAPGIDMLVSSLVAVDIPATPPRITAYTAQQKAKEAVTKLAPMAAYDSAQPHRTPELVVFDPSLFHLSGSTRLCWLISDGRIATLVDATSAAVVYQYSEVAR